MRKIAANDRSAVFLCRDHSAWAFFLPVVAVGGVALAIRLIGLDRQVFSDWVGLQYFDKAGHVILFGCLSYFFHHLGRTKTTWSTVKVICSSLMVVFLFGLLDETSQLWFENRQFEHLDLLANVLGAGLVGPLGCLPDRFTLRCARWCNRVADQGGFMGEVVHRVLEMKGAFESRVADGDDSLVGTPEPMGRTVRVLLIEDESRVVYRISHLIRSINRSNHRQLMAMESAGSLAKAISLLESTRFDVILLDLSLPDGQGIQLFDEMVRVAPATPVVVLANGRCWDDLIESAQGEMRRPLLKESLSPETLFWAIYHSYVGQGGGQDGERFGYRQHFGRISAATRIS